MRETIQRWEPEAGMWMERKAVGLYVTYSDHIERIAAEKARNKVLEEALRKAERCLVELYPAEKVSVEHKEEFIAVHRVLMQIRAALREDR